MSNLKIKINQSFIGSDFPVYFIADIAANHDGSLERAKQLIRMARKAGANAAKFQHFTADGIVSDVGFKALGDKLSHQSSWNKSVYEVYKGASVPMTWTEDLVAACKDEGIDFFTSPYDLETVDKIDPFVPVYKIGSGDITWIEIIRHIGGKGKPVLLAAGASDLVDIQRAMRILIEECKVPTVLMQCNTNYTASLENLKNVRLKTLTTFKSMYPNVPLGLSDHTPGHATVLGAVALGACVIEKHFTDDTTRVGPDHGFAMDPDSWRKMVEICRELEISLGDGNKRVEDNERESVILQRRCLRAVRNLSLGHTIQRSDLSVLRPAPVGSIAPYDINQIVGRKIIEKILEGEIISFKHIE
jgi:sialic acid synthase SpsE